MDLKDTPSELIATKLKEQSENLQPKLTLANFPRLHVVILDMGRSRSARLLIKVNHFIADAISMQVILDDFFFFYNQQSDGLTVQLPKTTSLTEWSNKLASYARSIDATSEYEYWRSRPWTDIEPLPVDHQDGKATRNSRAKKNATLSPDRAFFITHRLPRYGITIDEFLLTALATTLQYWTGNQSHLVEMYTHGRNHIFDDIDLSHTVGWLNTLFPVILTASRSQNRMECLNNTKNNLRGIPNQGVTFNALRYLPTDVNLLMNTFPSPQIWYHNLGRTGDVESYQTSSHFHPTTDDVTEPLHLTNRGDTVSNTLLDVHVSADISQLEIRFTYSRNVHQDFTIENLLDVFLQEVSLLCDESGKYH